MSGLLEANGKDSSIRMNMFLCTLAGCAVAIIGVLKGLDLVGLALLSGGLTTVGVVGKVQQKKDEK